MVARGSSSVSLLHLTMVLLLLEKLSGCDWGWRLDEGCRIQMLPRFGKISAMLTLLPIQSACLKSKRLGFVTQCIHQKKCLHPNRSTPWLLSCLLFHLIALKTEHSRALSFPHVLLVKWQEPLLPRRIYSELFGDTCRREMRCLGEVEFLVEGTAHDFSPENPPKANRLLDLRTCAPQQD